MRPMVIIYVIETAYEGRCIQCGCSLSREAAEQQLSEYRKNHPSKYYEISEYLITDTFTIFDWI